MSKAVKKEEEKQEYDFDNPITIPLKYPVKFGGEEITEVVLQPLTGRHIRGLSTSPSMDVPDQCLRALLLEQALPQQTAKENSDQSHQ